MKIYVFIFPLSKFQFGKAWKRYVIMTSIVIWGRSINWIESKRKMKSVAQKTINIYLKFVEEGYDSSLVILLNIYCVKPTYVHKLRHAMAHFPFSLFNSVNEILVVLCHSSCFFLILHSFLTEDLSMKFVA